MLLPCSMLDCCLGRFFSSTDIYLMGRNIVICIYAHILQLYFPFECSVNSFLARGRDRLHTFLNAGSLDCFICCVQTLSVSNCYVNPHRKEEIKCKKQEVQEM